jgi:hypothetical protein
MSGFGMKVELHPKFDPVSDSGFLPIKFSDEDGDYASGFEYCFGEYDHEYDDDYSDAVRERLSSCRHVVTLTFWDDDKYTFRSVLSFAAYLVDCVGGATLDDYEENMIIENAKEYFMKSIPEYENPYDDPDPFEGW